MLSSRDLYRLTKIVTVYVESTLDQPVTVQILGAVSSSPSTTVPIDSSFTVPPNSADAKTLVPESSGWLPYITVSLSCTTAPTTGAVNVYLVRLDGTVSTVARIQIRDTSTHTYKTDPASITLAPW
ncbi:MAG: hypothetical protein LM580_08975 [Thermofilum sp.]|nr:hypothetical protein [Thermofilum sp.]